MKNPHIFFETLGTKLKIDILARLKRSSLSVNELSEQLNQERSKVSHALRSLLACNFVKVKKDGRQRIYSLNSDTITPLFDLVEEHLRKYCKVCKRKEDKKCH